MRKTGSLEKKCGDSQRSVAFRFLGGTHIEGNEEKWFREKPLRPSLFAAEFEVLWTPPE